MVFLTVPIKDFFNYLRAYIKETWNIDVTMELQNSTKEQLTLYFVNVSNVKNTDLYNGSCDILVHLDYRCKLNVNQPYDVIERIVNMYLELGRMRGKNIATPDDTKKLRLYKSAIIVNPFADYDNKDDRHIRCEIQFSIDLATIA